jgi:PAS domain-containing protein
LDAQNRTVATSGETMDLEVSVRRHGKRHVYLSLKYPLRDEAGRIFAVAGICTDITRQKRAEE